VREDYGAAMVGNSERQGLLGSTIPYVDDPVERQWRIDTLLVDALYLLNPHNYGYRHDERTGRIYAQEGRGYYRFGRGWVDSNAYTGECLRALDYYAKYTGDLERIRAHWPMLRSMFYVMCDFPRHGEWESSCFDTGGGDTWDSVYNATVAFARLADRLGDDQSYRYACYYFAKRLATLPGQRQTNVVAARQPYWPSMLQVASFEDGEIQQYDPDLALPWRGGGAEIRDLVFSDLWGGNYGYRPWNQTVWMRGARSEYRAAAELAGDYARYWLDERVRKFSPVWYQQVLVQHDAPTDEAIDLRTGAFAEATAGDYVGKINVQARAIVLGESLEQLAPLYALRDAEGVSVGSDGRVPRLCTPAALLEDATSQPWVGLYGARPGQVSDGWERGRDAFMTLGDENYVTRLGFGEDGLSLSWTVFAAPQRDNDLLFGRFAPVGARLADPQSAGVNWNTTVYWAALENDGSR
jgi:hypothetical protein